MKHDWLGNPITVSDNATAEGINDFIEGFLGYENKAENILIAADTDAESCLANAYAAMFYMFLESTDAPNFARPYIERAESAVAGATRREQMTTSVVRAWVDGDIKQAIALSNQVTDEFSRDLTIVKQAQYHHFNLGQCKEMLLIAQKVESVNSDVCYMHGLMSFGYEQCHQMKNAEQSACLAIEMKRKEPWAHHAMAHVMLTQGRIDEGIRFLEEISETWVNLNSFMLTHNWWHLALKYISKGRYKDALALYDNHVWGVWKEYSQDQVGAVSLLMRLELVGVDIGNRWEDLAGYLKTRVNEFVQPFLSMQYLYGLARNDSSQGDEMFENLRVFAENAPLIARKAWREVAVPMCEGLLAHARGDHETVIRVMEQALPHLLTIGGSHAQRDLFYQVQLDSLIKTSRYSEAQNILEKRLKYEPLSVPNKSALVNVYQHLGLEREAARALALKQS